MDANKLIEQAIKAQGYAKAKYSNFNVGTALMSKNNKIILFIIEISHMHFSHR